MRGLKNKLYMVRVYAGIILTVSFFLMITGYIFLKGFHAIHLDFIFGMNKPEGASLLPAIVNTLLIILVTLVVSVPIGICSAIYLVEYAHKDSKVVQLIRLTTESLAGIPSIIYGIFGFLFFVIYLKFSWSILSGALTLAIMVLPTIVRSTEEALKSVPDSYREGSYALGVGKLRTIYKVILPSCISGILVAVILSVGRIVGETAALYLTAGTVMKIPGSLMNSGATLSVFMYVKTNEGLDFDAAYGTAIVLMIIVFIINIGANMIARKFKRG